MRAAYIPGAQRPRRLARRDRNGYPAIEASRRRRPIKLPPLEELLELPGERRRVTAGGRMTPAATLDLYSRAVASEAELKAWIEAAPFHPHARLWRDMLPLATELVAAARESVEQRAASIEQLAGTEVTAGTGPEGVDARPRGHGKRDVHGRDAVGVQGSATSIPSAAPFGARA